MTPKELRQRREARRILNQHLKLVDLKLAWLNTLMGIAAKSPVLAPGIRAMRAQIEEAERGMK